MDLWDYWRVVLRRWPLVILLAALGAGAGWGLAKITPPTYAASSSLYVQVAAGATPQELAQGSTFVQAQMPSYTALATTAEVLQPVIDDLDLGVTPAALARQITTENQLDTVVVTVRVRDGSPTRAADISRSATQSLADAIEQFTPALTVNNPAEGAPATKQLVEVKVLTPDPEPTVPIAPVQNYYIGGGVLVGLALGVLLAVIINAIITASRQRRARTADRAEGEEPLPVPVVVEKRAPETDDEDPDSDVERALSEASAKSRA